MSKLFTDQMLQDCLLLKEYKEMELKKTGGFINQYASDAIAILIHQFKKLALDGDIKQVSTLDILSGMFKRPSTVISAKDNIDVRGFRVSDPIKKGPRIDLFGVVVEGIRPPSNPTVSGTPEIIRALAYLFHSDIDPVIKSYSHNWSYQQSIGDPVHAYLLFVQKKLERLIDARMNPSAVVKQLGSRLLDNTILELPVLYLYEQNALQYLDAYKNFTNYL